MASAPAFDHLCSALEESSALDRLAARGTVRLALKRAGLDAASVTRAQLGVVIEKILPDELAARGVSDAPALCERLRRGLERAALSDAPVDSPEAVFTRLGGRG